MNEDQLKTSIHTELKPIVLPDTKLDLIEHFAFALQNRDAIGLRQLIDKNDTDSSWGDREGFIKKFIGFCDKMDKKHSGVYVHTVPGICGSKFCKKGISGLGITLNTTNGNKLLWRFNIVMYPTSEYTLSITLCERFLVKHEEIPF